MPPFVPLKSANKSSARGDYKSDIKMRKLEPENKDFEQESKGNKEDILANKFYRLFLGYSN